MRILAFSLLIAACDRSPSTTSPPIASTTPAPSVSASAPPAAPSASAAPDRPLTELEGVVGDWSFVEENGVKGLKVDGSKWRSGEPSANLADQAKHLYGDRYAEFLDGVKAFAFFPFAVWKKDPPKGDMRISVRFYPEGGKIDQAAGIIFAIGPDGTYWGVRANALENNILFFQVVKGKRTVFDNVRNVPTASKTWHTLVVELRGTQVTATLDEQKRFEKTLSFTPSGRIGLWSKADSQVLFDDFTVTSLVR